MISEKISETTNSQNKKNKEVELKEQTIYYHGTTIENARHILKEGIKGNKFFVTKRKHIAKQYGESKSSEQRFKNLLSRNDYSPCLLTLVQSAETVINSYSSIMKKYSDKNTEERPKIDKGSNEYFEYLTPTGFEKFVIVVESKDLVKIEIANEREAKRKQYCIPFFKTNEKGLCLNYNSPLTM